MRRNHQARARATKPATTRGAGAIVLAALALPGVCPNPAHAEGGADNGLVAFKYLYYQDSQPGLQRVNVSSPAVFVSKPIGSEWLVEASAVTDAVSGATPRWQSSISSASVMNDRRNAADVAVTRYFTRSSVSAGYSYSGENDYVSNAASLQGSWATDDNNTTLNAGIGGSWDTINPTNGGQQGVSDEKRRITEFMLGVTQAVSANDLAQVNVGYTIGTGYYDDPYKTLDFRPASRRQFAVLARWNHYLEGDGSALRGSYRYYHDSFGVNANTLQGEWVKPVSDALTLTGLVRLYSQSAANFYAPALYDPAGYPIFPDLQPGQHNSGDQRLAAFGAISLGLSAEYKLTRQWGVVGNVEGYEQMTSWHVGGQGSTGLDPFRAYFVQVGASYKF
ncbi:MAG: DUF3570 domain-containing protein [Burkholderiales bacterium]